MYYINIKNALSKWKANSFHLPSFSLHIVHQPLKDNNKNPKAKNPQKIKTCIYLKNCVNYFSFPYHIKVFFPLPFACVTLTVSNNPFNDNCQMTGLKLVSNRSEKEGQ